MLKKIFIVFLASFTLVFSTVGSYAKANSATDILYEVGKVAFVGVANAIAASASIGIKATEGFNENKQKIYDNAVSAYDSMSQSAKESWSAAVARGRTGSDMAGEVWESLKSAISNAYESDTVLDGRFYTVSRNPSTRLINFNLNSGYYVNIKTEKDGNSHYYEKLTSFNVVASSGGFYVYDIRDNFIKANTLNGQIDLYEAINNATIFSIGGIISSLTGGNVAIEVINSALSTPVVPETNSIYDSLLKRALENDLPKAKDAGLVIPQTEIKTPSGTRLNLDANTGTLSLPDGTIYNGDLDNLKIGTPDVIVGKTGEAVYTDGKTDKNVWTGEKTNTLTGEAVTSTGDTLLDRLLDGIGEIPTAFIKVLTGLFIPTQLASAWADLTNTLQSRLLLPDFGWLVNTGIMCTEDGKDIKMEFNGKTTTFVDMSWLYSVRSFYMPIMRGFLWFLFGWYVYRKAIAITNKVDGIEK